MERERRAVWPSPWIIFLCLLLFGLGELAGAILGGYPLKIMDVARGIAMAHPDVHGLVGVADIDRTILEKVGTETLSRIHTFHLHAHGLSLVAFVLSLILANTTLGPRMQRVLTGLVLLGLLYPFGWLTIALTLPRYGQIEAFRLAEKLFFIPFGTAFLLTIWVIIGIYFFTQVVGLPRRNSKKR